MKDLDKLLAEKQEAVARQPESAEAYYELGVILTEEERYEEALDAYGMAMKLDPSNLTYFYNFEALSNKI